MENIIYHAISAYQLFEVIVHRLSEHKNDYAELILPDFIERKYPNWRYLEEWKIFQKVRLLNYMKIAHDTNTIIENTEREYKNTNLSNLDSFDKIYVAGTHFFFSVYLAEKKIPFIAFEDAPGMVYQYARIESSLIENYPIQLDIAKQYGMINLTSVWIEKVITTEKVRKIRNKENIYFNAVKKCAKLRKNKKMLIWGFYHISNLKENITDSIIVLTQCFPILGIMSQEEQKCIYKKIAEVLVDEKVYIKKHPDDDINYDEVFVGTKYLPKEVPIEILASKLQGKPKYILTISSTSTVLLEGKYKIVKLSDFIPEYDDKISSMCKAINVWKNNTR